MATLLSKSFVTVGAHAATHGLTQLKPAVDKAEELRPSIQTADELRPRIGAVLEETP
jgi:hypothetical protein